MGFVFLICKSRNNHSGNYGLNVQDCKANLYNLRASFIIETEVGKRQESKALTVPDQRVSHSEVQ